MIWHHADSCCNGITQDICYDVFQILRTVYMKQLHIDIPHGMHISGTITHPYCTSTFVLFCKANTL